jgi:hypothetical protein
VADRGEGAGDQCHHFFGGEVVAHAAGCARAIAYSIRRRVSGIMEYYLRYLPKALQDIESGGAVSGGFS